MGTITPEFDYLWEQLHALEPKSKLGGIYAFKPGYHSTRADNQANWPGNYSITDKEDKGGPSDKAAAIDWTFPDAQNGDYSTIDKYSSRLLASGQDPDDDRLDGWREFYGQADKDTGVEGWDFRYARSASSDPSHLWHIHLSCDRDKVTSKANMDKLLSVLRGDDVALSSDDARKIWKTDGFMDNFPWWSDHPNQGGDEEFVTPETIMNRLGEMSHKAQLAAEKAAADVAAVLEILKSGVPIPGLVNLTPEATEAVAVATVDELDERI